MAYAPSVFVFADMNPCPRVEVVFYSLAPGTVTLTVWRECEGRQYRVRGSVRAATAGAFARVDYEVPHHGAVVSYRAEMFNASGVSLGFTDSAQCTVSFPGMVVHNPLDPFDAVVLQFRGDAARELSRPSEGNVYHPIGRTVGVVISGQRRGLSGLVLNVASDDDVTTNRFTNMTGGHPPYDGDTVPVLCFRKGAGERVRIPSPLFVSVLAPREVVPENYAWGGATVYFDITGDEVSAPAEGLVIPLVTRAVIDSSYATRAALDADNPTRIWISRRYDLIGGVDAEPVVIDELPPADDFYPEIYEDPNEAGFYLVAGGTL